ncbi:MAG: hypothetical protein ACKPKO_56980 [Candidatus Fonsibacter sp.]
MRGLIHQRNNFNNLHRMTGGMEDEERELDDRLNRTNGGRESRGSGKKHGY